MSKLIINKYSKVIVFFGFISRLCTIFVFGLPLPLSHLKQMIPFSVYGALVCPWCKFAPSILKKIQPLDFISIFKKIQIWVIDLIFWGAYFSFKT